MEIQERHKSVSSSSTSSGNFQKKNIFMSVDSLTGWWSKVTWWSSIPKLHPLYSSIRKARDRLKFYTIFIDLNELSLQIGDSSITERTENQSTSCISWIGLYFSSKFFVNQSSSDFKISHANLKMSNDLVFIELELNNLNIINIWTSMIFCTTV